MVWGVFAMKVEISKEIEADASLTIIVRRINHILAEIVENVADQVSAHWELAGELKSRILFLRLWYEDQGSGTTIDPKELENRAQLKSKLRDLWGDLLQVRMDGILARMKAAVGEEVGS
jgi:hypothetical protein